MVGHNIGGKVKFVCPLQFRGRQIFHQKQPAPGIGNEKPLEASGSVFGREIEHLSGSVAQIQHLPAIQPGG
ncbi:hypothetical protein SDC9_205889 [bioreactor metagenome]|uniref:Uncharacterized protein n=1 Tax=bioreactor metagenome TaxID=1076179 RepID=A0A645J3F5_9ZZZZ